MNNTSQVLTYLVIITLIAATIERLTRNNRTPSKSFSGVRYLLFIAYPLAASAGIIYGLGEKYLTVFLISAVFGIVAEWLIGFYYEKIVGQKLWVYKSYPISGYTSWLIMPLWGFTGLLFALLISLAIK